MRSSRLVTVLLLGAVLQVAAQGRDTEDAATSVRAVAERLGVFTDHVDVTVTNLFVTVTDRDGEPVTGLAPADFVVVEDGREVEITHFAAYAPRSGPVEAAEEGPAEVAAEAGSPPGLEPSTGPQVALLFDNTSLRIKNRSRVVAELRVFSDRVLAGGGRVLVSTADPELSVLTPFTASSEVVASALDEVLTSKVDGDALASRKRLIERDIHQVRIVDPNLRIRDYGAAQERRIEADVEAYRSLESKRVRNSFASLEELLRILNGVPGRTTVLWVGEDVPLKPALDLYRLVYDKFRGVAQLDPPEIWGSEQDLTREVQRLAGVAQTGPVTVHFLDSGDRARDVGGADLGSASAESVLASATTLSYGFDPVRIRDVVEGSQYMAEVTGGEALVGTRNVAPYLDRLGNLLDSYYSLGYTRPGAPDGSLHSVKVEVKQPGLSVATQQKVRNSPTEERLGDVALSRLQLDEGVNTIGMELILGAPRPAENARGILRSVGVKIPTDAVLLLPVEGGLVGEMMMAVRVLDRKGAPSKPQIDVGPVTVPEGVSHVYFEVPLLIPRGARRIAVAIRDELSGVEASELIVLED